VTFYEKPWLRFILAFNKAVNKGIATFTLFLYFK
jgi:hypothetical protein